MTDNKANTTTSTFRTKSIGPLNFVYKGGLHVGNIVAPILGGNNKKATKWTATSKAWGQTAEHNSYKDACAWLQKSHGVNNGATMKKESLNEAMEHAELLRSHGWSTGKTTITHNEYRHSLYPHHTIAVSNRGSNAWSHSGSHAKIHGYGNTPESLAKHLNKFHATKEAYQEILGDVIHLFREEFDADWVNVFRDVMQENSLEHKAKLSGMTKEDVKKHFHDMFTAHTRTGMAPKYFRSAHHLAQIAEKQHGVAPGTYTKHMHESEAASRITHDDNTPYKSRYNHFLNHYDVMHTGTKKVMQTFSNEKDADDHANKLNTEGLTEEELEGKTPYSSMEKHMHVRNIRIVKRDPTELVNQRPGEDASTSNKVKDKTVSEAFLKVYNNAKEKLIEGSTSLFKYNKITGLWKHERTFDNPENAPAYLAHYQKDYPSDHFHVGKNKPKHNPIKNMKEELVDNDKMDKDPNSGPQGKPNDKLKKKPLDVDPEKLPEVPAPKVSIFKTDDAEQEIVIKKTMTGEPGPVIQINPLMTTIKNQKGIGDKNATMVPGSDDHKKKPTD